MAALEKYNKAAAVGILRHVERQPGETYERKNKDIDSRRTCENYTLVPELAGMTLQQRIDAVLESEHVWISPRKDLNVLCDWVITKPPEITNKAETSKFFQKCYEFLCDRYGASHVIMASVHMDESTPHIHCGILPVAPKEDGTLTVSSRRIFTRTELQEFHPALSKYMQGQMGKHISITTGVTAANGGNQSIEEMKAAALQTAEAAYKQIVESDITVDAKPQKLHKGMVTISEDTLTTLVQAVRMAEVKVTQAAQAMQEVGQREQAVRARERAIAKADVTQLEKQITELEVDNRWMKRQLEHFHSMDADVDVEF